jgi:hypothetical protein
MEGMTKSPPVLEYSSPQISETYILQASRSKISGRTGGCVTTG